MTLAFLDEHVARREQSGIGAPRVRSGHTPRRGSSASVAGRRPSRRARLRLTARGRLVFGCLLVLVALLLFSLGRFSAGAEASGPPLRVTVQSGDTLWSIAQKAAPDGDPRPEVDRIVSANHLADEAALSPGTVLLVPRG